MSTVDIDIAQLGDFYKGLDAKHAEARTKLGHPLTLAEKILFSHISSWPSEKPVRCETTLSFSPDRVALQDATAQMALLQYMVAERDTVDVPASIHCDHLIRAKVGSDKDLLNALDENAEVYEFLKSVSQRYGLGFWAPGAGIIHQVVLEQYAVPGGMMIGTDSHTPNMGGLGMLAIGVGGADAVDVLAGQPWSLLNPKLVGVKLTGKLSGWSSPKDVILKVASELTVKGGTGRIVEYFGPGANSISCTGKATITNMGAEIGATTSVFAYDDAMARYLRATSREEVASLADQYKAFLTPDPEIEANPEKYYDEVLEIDLSTLKPAWVGPHTPDLRNEVSAMKKAIADNDFPEDFGYALIGSCTNSSYEDISRAASVAKQAMDRGLKTAVPLLVTPGSDQIFRTIERDGFLEIFESVGATVLANACGPCIGQWSREDGSKGKKNAIITSYNRNFKKRNDGNESTLAFIGSPEVVTALAFSGKLGFDPARDSLNDSEGKEFMFSDPSGVELPSKGFVFSREGYIAPADSEEERKKVEVAIDPKSNRLSFLETFDAWDGKDFEDLVVLLKADGKCTTDHISQAGPWLKYRGHLERISDNCYLGAVNAFTGKTGTGKNVITGEEDVSFPEIGKYYRKNNIPWIVIADENYGEGSSREHAAMEPRFLGCKVVLVRSFARIAEANLKKQGVLPLTFENPSDYDLINEEDRISVKGLAGLAPGSQVTIELKGEAGNRSFNAFHSLTDEEISWFKAGSALNTLRP